MIPSSYFSRSTIYHKLKISFISIIQNLIFQIYTFYPVNRFHITHPSSKPELNIKKEKYWLNAVMLIMYHLQIKSG